MVIASFVIGKDDNDNIEGFGLQLFMLKRYDRSLIGLILFKKMIVFNLLWVNIVIH